jgi:signal transduction histidine kinase
VQVQLAPQVLKMTGDKSQLQQVLLNLMTNASEAFVPTFQGVKRISVHTRLEDNRILLTVADNGSGIPSDIEAQVFELLRTSKDTGMGIGLWLSKTIVESHQGQINFTTTLNAGTTFTVALPAHTETMYF